MQDRKINDASTQDLDELFRFCFLIVGLRQKNFPNPLETLFLHQFVRDEYGMHTLKEIRLAFSKLVKGQLDVEEKEISCYENFSVLYLSKVINAYRAWSSQEYRLIESELMQKEEPKLLEGPQQKVEWRKDVERAYQHYLSFGGEQMELWPPEFYYQLSDDGYFEKEFYRQVMPSVRSRMISTATKIRTSHELKAEMVKNLSGKNVGINNTNIRNAQEKIDGYKSGKLDSEIELKTKQYVVLKYFELCKKEMKQTIYVYVQPTNETAQT